MLLQVRGCDGSLRSGDEDVHVGRCCGWVRAVRWGGCLQDMSGAGGGSGSGSSRAMISVHDEAFSFSLPPRSPTPQVMRTATTLRERTRNLFRSTEVKGQDRRVLGCYLQLKCILLFTRVLASASFTVPTAPPNRYIESGTLKFLGPLREKLVESDAAVTLLLPEIDIVNHTLSRQYYRYRAVSSPVRSASELGVQMDLLFHACASQSSLFKASSSRQFQS